MLYTATKPELVIRVKGFDRSKVRLLGQKLVAAISFGIRKC